jgi:hypothetical protein
MPHLLKKHWSNPTQLLTTRAQPDFAQHTYKGLGCSNGHRSRGYWYRPEGGLSVWMHLLCWLCRNPCLFRNPWLVLQRWAMLQGSACSPL